MHAVERCKAHRICGSSALLAIAVFIENLIDFKARHHVCVVGHVVAVAVPVIEPFATIDLHWCDQLAVIYAVNDSQVDDRITRAGQISFWRADVASQVCFGDL